MVIESDLREHCVALMKGIAERLLEPEDNRRRIRPELWSDPAFVDVGLRGELPSLPQERAAAGL